MAFYNFTCKANPETRSYVKLLALAKETLEERRQKVNRDAMTKHVRAGNQSNMLNRNTNKAPTSPAFPAEGPHNEDSTVI